MRRLKGTAWVPAAVLGVGCLLNLSVATQRSMPLADSLATIPLELAGYAGHSQKISPDEVRVAGTTSSLLRIYERDSLDFYSVYVGYYDRQRQGRTIHSPKNCLPGGGWEPLDSRSEVIALPTGGLVRANRWTIAKQNQRAVVFYWYQGRGRTESDEYRVKFDLLRDSALHRRSEEALVRIVVPLTEHGTDPDSLARRVIVELAPHLARILPS